MANVVLSEGEKTYILHGVEDDMRCDGRSRLDYRPLELETNLVSNSSGSARVRLANTDVLVGVKMEIDKPLRLTPKRGKLEFFVDCSANATPEFQGRGGEELAVALVNMLKQAYESPRAFDLESLCILPGQQCWKLYIDILILECGGNLYDAVSIAAKAALFSTKLPRVTAAMMDAGEADLTISDDPYDCTRLAVDHVPIFVTVAKIGDCCVVDPTAEEEECSTASLVVAVTIQEGKCFVTGTHIVGEGSLHSDTVDACITHGTAVGEKLNNELMKALTIEMKRLGPKRQEPVGFLK